jgi:sulfatase maturation enzyme AslB (radical SAM superfamily)
MKTWNLKNLGYLHIELSNLCNAACPMCPRYIYHTETIDPSLTLKQMSLEDFKKYFPQGILENIHRITFCGTHGDPMTARDFIPILEYVFKCNSKMQLAINTNGGLRNTDFWTQVGTILKDKNHAVTFSIDGLEDTNHLYRRKVNWNKLMENAAAFITAGGVAYWDYLIFEHNEHQIEDAKQLSKTMGFVKFFSKRALGFSSNTDGTYKPTPVYDKNGDFVYYLSPPSDKEYVNLGEKKVEHDLTEKVNVDWYMNFRNKLTTDNLDDKYKIHIDKKINCKFLNRDTVNNFTELYVNANGTVIPCCFMGSAVTGSYGEEQELQVRNIIDNNKNRLDLNINSLEDVLSSDVLYDIFVQKWQLAKFSEGKPVFCSLMCGENNSIDRIFIDKGK